MAIVAKKRADASVGSTAAQDLGGMDADYELIARIKHNYEATPVSAKMKAFLPSPERFRKAGNTFCMFNRYVDGLATWQPRGSDIYHEIGVQTAQLG